MTADSLLDTAYRLFGVALGSLLMGFWTPAAVSVALMFLISLYVLLRY